MAILGAATLLAGSKSWRHNAAAGLHRHDAPKPMGGHRRRRRPPTVDASLAPDGE
jgi:hypothetical protein